jgi:hypothetical protein
MKSIAARTQQPPLEEPACDALPTFHVAEKIKFPPPLSPVRARQNTDQGQFSTYSLLPPRQKTVVDLEVVQKAWIAHAFH